MNDRDRPRTYGLDARLDRLERDLARLGAELAQVRALVSGEAASAPPSEAVVRAEPVSAPVAPVAVEPPPAAVPKPKPAPAPQPAPARPAATATTSPPRPTARPPGPPKAPPAPPRRTLGDLARDWDLVGARGFAIVGGAVMALGIGFFFVLAANRGWIDEQARVALGASASALVFGAGLVLRARYGQYWSALAAVAAGIAGAYATLAAAAARYDLVPDGLALPLAGVIAAAGTAVAVGWRSQVIASIGLLGAALAPALQALDTDMTWESAAFAIVVLVAAGAVALLLGWRELPLAVAVVVGLQVEWLAAEPPPVGAGTVAVAAAFVLCLLGIGVGRQLVAAVTEVEAIALGYVLASFGLTLAFAVQVLDERTDRGIALLAAAAIWALVFAALQWRREPDLAFVVGAAALGLAAVGTADLLSDSALTIAWAAQAVVLAALARRLGDARLQAMAAVYVTLAGVHAIGYRAFAGEGAFASDNLFAALFDEAADHLSSVLPLAAVAVAATASGVLVPTTYVARSEGGLLAFLADLRRTLEGMRRGYREAMVVVGAAFATLSAAFALVSASFEWGHIAATALAALVGAVILAGAGRLRSDGLAIGAYGWLGLVLGTALFFDAEEFYDDVTELSTGGWALLAASGGLLGGAYAHRVAWPGTRARDVVLGVSAGVAAWSTGVAISLLTTEAQTGGLGLLVVAAVYGGLAAGVFTRETCRNASTVLWSLGLAFLVGAELLLVTDEVWRSVALVATALAVGSLAAPLREWRLWLAGASLLVATSVVVLAAQAQPWVSEGDLERRSATASAAAALVAFGLAALVWRRRRWRDFSTVVWADGIVLLLATERVLLGDWQETTTVAALTGGAIALLGRRLAEQRLWLAGLVVAGLATLATLGAFTPVSHFFEASESPADGLWVLAGCIVALGAIAVSAFDARLRLAIFAAVGGLALYALSLGILGIAERVSTASVETDFERGHTAVSGLWALVGLALLVLGLLRGSAWIRYGGLALFGLSLAKIFLYDLASLSSVARAFSFILVGGLLLAGGFFLQRLSDRIGPRPPGAPFAA